MAAGSDMEVWPIGRLVSWVDAYLAERGVDAPRLSAELLVSHVLGCRRIDLYTRWAEPVDEQRRAALRDLVRRAGAHEPIAYLVGCTEFYSLTIHVDQRCLIPRPETELLVERAIEALRRRQGEQEVLDLCTGSGCIAVAVARNFERCRVVATDVSDGALAVAAENVRQQGLEHRVRLLCGDLFEPIIAGLDAARFDIITCNPPYVRRGDLAQLEPNVRDYEPALALDGGADGLEVYRRIAAKVGDFLRPGGVFIGEIGADQSTAIQDVLRTAGCFAAVRVESDAAGHDRVVIAEARP